MIEIKIEGTIVEVSKDRKILYRMPKGVFDDSLKAYGIEMLKEAED